MLNPFLIIYDELKWIEHFCESGHNCIQSTSLKSYMLKYKYIGRGYESDKLENFVFNSIYTKSIWESKLDWKRFQSFERKMQKKKTKIISMDSHFSDNYLTAAMAIN